jgi:hypothetical protein
LIPRFDAVSVSQVRVIQALEKSAATGFFDGDLHAKIVG